MSIAAFHRTGNALDEVQMQTRYLGVPTVCLASLNGLTLGVARYLSLAMYSYAAERPRLVPTLFVRLIALAMAIALLAGVEASGRGWLLEL